MSEKRIQFNTIVQNQLPSYVRGEFPLISEFLKQYYISQEFEGAPIDLIQNIDNYIKLDQTTNLPKNVILKDDISVTDTEISVDLILSPTGTEGFPDSYGLLRINDEIITYSGKTFSTFTGCVRGFSGITTYISENNPESLTFSTSEASDHSGTSYDEYGQVVSEGDSIENLNLLFLKQFLIKTKNQFLPGLNNRTLDEDLNQNLFIKQSRDFYLTRGTDRSFEILFKALYNEDVKIIKPSEYLLTPSNADYRITNDLVVESFSGDPLKLENSFLYQDSYGENISKAYAPITSVEKLFTVGFAKTYYKVSYDAGYDRDLIVKGALYGDFSVHPKTKVIGEVSPGSVTIDVDSTVGFPTSGEIYTTYNDNTEGVISYTSKSLTQFYGCSNITGIIENASSVGINTYAYGKYVSYENTGAGSTQRTENIVKVRVNSVISNLNYPNNTYYYSIGDETSIKSLGFGAKDFLSKGLIYNVASSYNVEKIELLDSVNNVYKVTLYKDHYYNSGDKISITGNDNISKNSTIIEIISNISFSIRGQGPLSIEDDYVVQKQILKSESNSFPSFSQFPVNILNSYKYSLNENSKTLVASHSLPYYSGQPLDAASRSITFSGTFSGDEFEISSDNHNLYTGDAVYYIPEKITQQFFDGLILTEEEFISSSLFEEGLYFVKRVSTTKIKLAKSRTDIYNSKFVTIDTPVTVTNNIILPYQFNSKTLKPQKLFREISSPNLDGNVYKTEPGYNGILINGVEILNYKSKDLIYYGELADIQVTSPGDNYDIISPPVLNISDDSGEGASGYVSVSGSLKEIRVIDPGFDYVDKPKVSITGGNGSGAEVSVNMKLIEHNAEFFADISSKQVGIGTSVSTIGFSTYHKFRNAEKVIYETGSQESVGGIGTNSQYYVSIIDPLTVKLHKTQEDAISGINTIPLTSYGIGKQSLRSVNKKSVVDYFNIVSSGSNYENKQRTTSSSGISTSLNQIIIPNHDYKSGEIVVYNSFDTEISGLENNQQYYVTKIDDDTFKLSSVGVGSTNKDFFYNTNQYINFDSTGVGTHSFNYPPITVTLSGKIGISSVGENTFECQTQPIFRGRVTSVKLRDHGVGYGSSEVINLEREPNISLTSGENAQLLPIVNNGQITEVVVLNSGRNYNSPPDLVIDGDGVGAVLTPIVNNGFLTSVIIINSGLGYSPENTSIRVISPGSSASFKAKIQTWRINLFQKYFNSFSGDDGFISLGLNPKYELQYCHLYAPRKLRESVFSTDQTGKILYGKKDLIKSGNSEVQSADHSPIIGWSYDGYPIYGPYGYVTKSGGTVSQMKSGYKLNKSRPYGPPVSMYPLGFFVEDFTHYKVSDETVLDENNGRFCVTPQFPEGTYAYFATLDPFSVDTSLPFLNYKRPQFPYLIGDNFKGVPNKFNYDIYSNQDDYDLNEYSWFRNTEPYNLIEGSLKYDYLNIPDKFNQKSEILNVKSAPVESIGIVTGGNNYQVNDQAIFEEEGTGGSGLSVKVDRILGKNVNSVSVATSSISNVEIIPNINPGQYTLISENPHNFSNQNRVIITGVSTDFSKLEGVYTIGIGSISVLSVSGVGTTSIGIESVNNTGIVTYFNLSGNLSGLESNDILIVGEERVKVLNVDREFSRVRVLRSIDNTSGTSHSVGTYVYEDSRRILINTGIKTTFAYKENKEIYFNPIESIGLGTNFGVGIGTTIFLSNPGSGISQVYIPTKSIYIKNHGFKTGDQLTYLTNGGDSITALENGSSIGFDLTDYQNLFVAKIDEDLIGISTVKVGLDTTGSFVGIASTLRSSTTLFFTGIGTGVYHSFKTNYSLITCEAIRNIVTVSTAQTHRLNPGCDVYVDVNPSTSSTISVLYNDYNRKVLINPKSFSSSGVNTSTNAITINDHGFITGQKVLHTAQNPSEGLETDKIYYVVKIDNDSFKLSGSYYESVQLEPSIVGISSTSSGSISPINPPITAYKNSSVEFDMSDSSLSYINQATRYPAFELNFYTDENFTQVYDKSINNSFFDVQRVGVVGVSSDAKTILTISQETPEILYYKLDPVFNSDTPSVKYEVNVDNEVFSNNRIISKSSSYNGKHKVSTSSSTEFTYNLDVIPEKSSYISSTSQIYYETDCVDAYGPISKLKIENPGNNYYSTPGFSTITSDLGFGAILETFGSSIGRITKTRIKDIGFDFSADKTLRPVVSLPQIIKIEPFASFDSIEITSIGRGYTKPPKLLVFDGKTKEIVPDVELEYNSEDTQVTILSNTFGINNTTPVILPVQNTNGVGISTIFYDENTKDATVILSVGFSTEESFPFAVNDKILIENVSVGIGSTGKGFNSENYNYQLFTVTNVDENIGGIGSVTYNLSEFLNPGDFVGTYDPRNSFGRIIPQKYFPTFNPILKINEYIPGELVSSKLTSSNGIVQSWDPQNTILKITSTDEFEIGDILEGSSSRAQGYASSIQTFDSSFDVSPSSRSIKGWQNDSGFLNDNLQRIQDNFYYQKFSYSLKSKVDFDTWEDVVGSLNHTLGFRKFSDYQAESKLSDQNNNSLIVGITTELSYFESIRELLGIVNLNCVYDFDLVTENSISYGEEKASNNIVFSSKILTDYEESIGNRVLSIDDISGSFNSSPRSTNFSVVNTFRLSDYRAQKYVILVSDKRFTAQKQLLIVDLIHDELFGYMNQYGRVETYYELGSFDFSIFGNEGRLLFYPNNYSINDYNITCLSYNIDDNLLGIGSTSLGNSAIINTDSVNISSGVSTTIVAISSNYTSAKVLVEISPNIDSNEFEFTELNIIHNGTDIELLNYGQLTTIPSDYASSGLGTYNAYFSDSLLKVDFVPNLNVGIGTTGVINTIQVGLLDNSFSGIGTIDIKHSRIESRTTSIASTDSPTENIIANYTQDYDSSYFIVQVSDVTNNEYQLSEVIVVDDYSFETESGLTYDTEYGVIETSVSLGTIGSRVSVGGTVELLFTPIPDIDVQVKVYMNALRHQDDDKDLIDFNNGTIETIFSDYTGTERDIKRSFQLKNNNNPIFERYFDASDPEIVDISDNSIILSNHFFVSGESVVYESPGVGSTQSIGITTTSMNNVGFTDKLPSGIASSVYVVKVDENKIRLASSAENALKSVPEVLDLTTVGIGSSHRITCRDQNTKVLISLDNIIQSPVVPTKINTTLADQVFTIDNTIKFSGITSFFGSDLIKINDEIMKIEGVGIGSTNLIRVRRQWLGTTLAGHSQGDVVTKVTGNYNIVDNTITFTEAPYGNIPIGTSTNPPDERDWIGITTSSKFNGRSFMRSGVLNTSDRAYDTNYVLDDISSDFNGDNNTFAIQSQESDLTGISTGNAIILINDVFQGPGVTKEYVMSENVGVTSITFTGTATSTSSDANSSKLPRGGIIVSVGSSEGFGYQPLVSAGATVVVSVSGTIQSVSVGNSGSGYRAPEFYEILTETSSTVSAGSTEIYLSNQNSVFGIANLLNTGSNCSLGVGTFITEANVVSTSSTFINIGLSTTSSYDIPSGTSVKLKIRNPNIGVVNVSVADTFVGINSITHIGFATVISGNISTSVSITSPGFGYSSIHPPIAILDSPDSYSDLPLQYISGSGVGTGAKINVVVGQGSSVIDFEITNTGYGYGNGEILTVPAGGVTGIPTSSNFRPFEISIQNIFDDKFTGWTLGQLESFDDFDTLFDGETRSFQLTKFGQIRSILAGDGSNIDVQNTLLIFINDVLQVPGEGYIFDGGSIVTFSEAPKPGDTSKIVFYRGTGGVDVITKEIIETVKVGDELTIGYDPNIGQESYLQEESRVVTDVESTDQVETFPYFGPGRSEDETLLRPVLWCRQTEDKIINEKQIGKDRELYEAVINPVAYIISKVGVGQTVVYVDNLRPFFDPQNENDIFLGFQNSVKIISQDQKVGASATAVVSGMGTISSINIIEGGSGYTSPPTITIGSTSQSVGLGTTATAYGSISAGILTSIILSNPGTGYTTSNPPSVLISTPTSVIESNDVSSYSGDSGIIVGFGTTTQSFADKFIFDFYIPNDSYLKDTVVVNTPTTVSSINVNDYFIVYDSNVGLASTSITSINNINATIGIGTRFIDNVYQVDSVSTIESNIIGIGTTSIRRVYAKVSGVGTVNFSSDQITFDSTESIYRFDSIGEVGTGYTGVIYPSNYFGRFSWGKIELINRSESNEFNFYGENGIGGITTSPIVQRIQPLRYRNYLV